MGITELFRRDRHRKKIRGLLSHANDEAFVQMVWAIDALQTERVEAASKYISFPAEAATPDIDAKFAIRKWELETLLGQLLVTPKAKLREGKNRNLDCTKFEAAVALTNQLRDLEDAEAAILLKRHDVVKEMRRIGRRQFPWQRGYFNVPQFYRYAYIYGRGDCSAYFEQTYKLPMNDFSLVGFAIYTGYQSAPSLLRRYNLQSLGVAPEIVEKAVTLLAAPVAEARRGAQRLVEEVNAKRNAPLPTAYQPSYLRRFPIIAFGDGGERLRSPIPQLIALRITAGIFYDLVGGPSGLRNEAAKRFENYCAEYFGAMLPSFEIGRSDKYLFNGNTIETPDILIKNGEGSVLVVVECKPTKLTFGAQFGEDPVAEATSAYGEIAKGVFQVWRYFSHIRQGFFTVNVSSSACGLVLTLDAFVEMSADLQQQVLDAANVLADEEGGITKGDRRTVVFCSVEDLESTLAAADENSFLAALAAAAESRFAGWLLPNIHRETRGKKIERKKFPFELGEVLPWWKEIPKLVEREKPAA